MEKKFLCETPEPASDLVFPMLTEGVWAEVEVAGEYPRHFS
jgi:hypothetical protein